MGEHGTVRDTMEGRGLVMGAEDVALMIAHCLRAYPLEGCGLIATAPGSPVVERCYATRNAAESARLYTVHPLDHLRADRDAEEAGLVIAGVFHSHTHTDPYPSPTDVGQAPDPSWHYVLVSLRHEMPSIRSYRIVAGEISEEALVVTSPHEVPSIG
ncbi:MAG TPA: M67 family metallopeptidase [Acidimicrobiales bacterium]|nr:M67 family metallopeptidase [Acidimicrobiales bacterium]